MDTKFSKICRVAANDEKIKTRDARAIFVVVQNELLPECIMAGWRCMYFLMH